jgi:sugar-specific transcriptional regulator TrmB
MNKPLGLILQEKALLEAEIEEAHGEITEDLDSIWENNQMELAEKVDNYAWVLKHLDSVIENIRERKRKADKIIKSIANQQKRIKTRLHYYCEQVSGPLRGHEYSFHPRISVKREVNIDKVEPDKLRITVTMMKDQYLMLRKVLDESGISIPMETGEATCNVTDLPENHPAITKEETPSVTMR